MLIHIVNDGPNIKESNYWDSEFASHGKLIISPNAGVIRCLLPPRLWASLKEIEQAEYAIVSVGPWSVKTGTGGVVLLSEKGVEILWEDHSPNPHVWHVTDKACLGVPGDPGEGQWRISCWITDSGKPHKALEKPCYWRRVPEIPWLKPWEE